LTHNSAFAINCLQKRKPLFISGTDGLPPKYLLSQLVEEGISNFSKNSGFIRKIPLNTPLQKGEAVGMPEVFERLQFRKVRLDEKLWIYLQTDLK
jgi:hypothetical protein